MSRIRNKVKSYFIGLLHAFSISNSLSFLYILLEILIHGYCIAIEPNKIILLTEIFFAIFSLIYLLKIYPKALKGEII